MTKLLSLMLLSSTCYANEPQCLAEIMYAEDRQNIQGTLEVGNASINRAANQSKPICRISGVQRKPLTEKVKPYFISLAATLMKSPRFHDADSWDSGRKPHLPGVIRAQAGGQVFYKMKH